MMAHLDKNPYLEWNTLKSGVNEDETSFPQVDNRLLSSSWLTPEKVEMCQSGVKGNFYAPFVGEGK
jgi:hypothetical protein